MNALFQVAAVLAAVGVIVKFSPLRRVVLWLWCRNVSEPLTAKADEIVTSVVNRELKERDGNGSVSLVDLNDHVELVCDRVDGVQTTVDSLVELGASNRSRLDALAEHAAELAALNAQGRKDDIVELAALNAQGRKDDIVELSSVIGRVSAKIDDVHEEVTTLNGKTIAVIADEGETRRIEDIPIADRTVKEQAHIDAIPPESPGGS